MSLIVIKTGGAVATQPVGHVLALAESGHRVCVVHGAGPQISSRMEQRGLQVRFVDGRRATSPEVLVVVREAMEDVNRRLCRAIGPLAVGMMGDEIGLLAEVIPALGLVGEARPARPKAITEALEGGNIPVVAPLARGPLNVNADEAAAALAIGLQADQLLFETDVRGVMRQGEVLSTIAVGETRRLLDRGEFEGGIVPKMQAAARAAESDLDVRIGVTHVVKGTA